MNRGIVHQSATGRRLLWSALSAVSLVLIVVAVPVALYLAGGLPLSHLAYRHVGRAVAATHSFDGQLAAHWLARGALLLAWVTWAWMTVCVLRELKAWVGGRSSSPLPASRTMQSIAACLVGTALTMAAVGRQVPGSGINIRPAPAGSTASTVGGTGPRIRVIEDLVPLLEGRHVAVPSRSDGLAGGSGPKADLPEGRVQHQGDGPRSANGGEPAPGVDRGPRAATTVSYSAAAGSGPKVIAPVPPDRGRSGAAGAGPNPVHLVASRDTLWSIATAELGSALRWKEIADLNYQVRQADGRSLDSTHWIRPGWRLLMPVPDGRWTAAAQGGPGQGGTGEGGTPEAIDADRDGTAEAMDAGRAGAPDSMAVPQSSPPLVPSVGSPEPDVRTDRGDWAIEEGAHGPERGDPTVTTDSRDSSHRLPPGGGQRPPSTPLGAGVMGSGVVNILDRMRRVQQRHRRSGQFIGLPDRSQRAFEQRARLGDGREIVAEVDGALRLLARARTAAELGVLTVAGVKVHPEVIEITMGELGGMAFEGPVPEEFHLLEDGHTLVIDRLALRETVATDPDSSSPRSPAPLMATVGQGPDGVVMVNLESLGAVVVNGGPEACEGMMRALALELATSYWADQFDLELVGFGSELERFERVTSNVDVPALINRLCRRSIDGAAVLRSTGFTSFFQARCIEDSSVWDPMVVLCGPDTREEELLELLEVAAHPRSGTAIVAVGEQSGDARLLTLTDPLPRSSLELLGSVIFPQQIGAEELTGVTSLLEVASTRASVPFDAEPYGSLSIAMPAAKVMTGEDSMAAPGAFDPDTSPTSVTEPPAPTSNSAAQGWNRARSTSRPLSGFVSSITGGGGDEVVTLTTGTEVEVAVLGSVEIRNAAREFTRAWAKELVVYLAMHPNGVSNEAWATALWPDRMMAPSSLHSTASVARRSLGQSKDGRDHLPRSHGRLALAATVGSDWARFVVLADSGDVGSWRMAMDLVRGRPFEGLRSSDWPVLEGIGPAIEAAVVDVSGRLAGACLAAGDARGAEWSARKGLLVSPYDERLYRMLMRASDLAGNPAGVEAVMAELVKLVADDIEPFDSVHPSTMDLYRSLTRRRSTAATTVPRGAQRQVVPASDSPPRGSAGRQLPTGRGS
jgi:DNA-binding SARP family transcriptional activator